MRFFGTAAALLALIPSAASGATLTGRVTDLISGDPVQYVQVQVEKVRSGVADSTFTAADGTWSIDEPDAGQYVACFYPNPARNLLRRCWGDDSIPYGTPIKVPPDSTVDGIDAALAPGTSITGVVTDRDGYAMPGVCISVWTPHSGWLRIGDTTTANDGTYSISGLIPGVGNRLVFSGIGGGMRCAIGGGFPYPGLVDQWFDGQSDIDSATQLKAHPSETLAGIDAHFYDLSTIEAGVTPPPVGVTPAPGQTPPPCVVPKLRHRTFRYARDALSDAGCSTLMPKLTRSRAFRRGSVITSKPAAKARLRRGRPVLLTVSRGR